MHTEAQKPYLSSFDDNSVSRKVHTPGQRCSGNQHLNVAIGKKFLDQGPVNTAHSGMVDSKSVGQEILKLWILDTDGKGRERKKREIKKGEKKNGRD